MPTRRIATGLAVGCLAILTAGCGSSGSAPSASSTTTSPTPTPTSLSAGAYRSALHDVAQEEDAAQHRIEQAFHAHTVNQVRAALTTFAADQRQVATQLTALTPPADAVAANAQLGRAFNDNATAIDSLLTKLRPAKTVKQALGIIQSDQAAQQVGHEIDAALAKLKKLGYATGS